MGRPTIAPIGPPSAARRSVAVAAMAAVAALAAIVAATAAARAVIAAEVDARLHAHQVEQRSEEHTSELQSLMRISYAAFCLNKKNSLSLDKFINQQSITISH